MPTKKNQCFAPQNLIYGILVEDVAKISTYAHMFWFTFLISSYLLYCQSEWIMVSTAPNLMIPWSKHLSLSVWWIYIKDRWVTRGEETAISILPQEQLTTILLFWETVIVIWQAAPPLPPPLHWSARTCVTPQDCSVYIQSSMCIVCLTILPLTSALFTAHAPAPPRLLMASIAFNNRGDGWSLTGQGVLGASGSGLANLPQTGACLLPVCSTQNLCGRSFGYPGHILQSHSFRFALMQWFYKPLPQFVFQKNLLKKKCSFQRLDVGLPKWNYNHVQLYIYLVWKHTSMMLSMTMEALFLHCQWSVCCSRIGRNLTSPVQTMRHEN